MYSVNPPLRRGTAERNEGMACLCSGRGRQLSVRSCLQDGFPHAPNDRPTHAQRRRYFPRPKRFAPSLHAKGVSRRVCLTSSIRVANGLAGTRLALKRTQHDFDGLLCLPNSAPPSLQQLLQAEHTCGKPPYRVLASASPAAIYPAGRLTPPCYST